jgi:hypothetical protein
MSGLLSHEKQASEVPLRQREDVSAHLRRKVLNSNHNIAKIVRSQLNGAPSNPGYEPREVAGVRSGPGDNLSGGLGLVGFQLDDLSLTDLAGDQVAVTEKEYGAHSMWAGFLTSAAANGADLFKMMDVSRHKSVDTLRG